MTDFNMNQHAPRVQKARYNERTECLFMTRRVGNTTFRVKVSCPATGTETMEEKILRFC